MGAAVDGGLTAAFNAATLITVTLGALSLYLMLLVVSLPALG
jgi:hypothetical protein